MTTYLILSYLMLLHFIGDFLLQSREMGTKKSEELRWLIAHVGTYGSVLFIGAVPIISHVVFLPVTFFLIVIGVHAVQDWFIWRVYKLSVVKRGFGSSFEYWKDKWFYTTIGFDQLLHVITIILAYGVTHDLSVGG